MRTSGVIPGVCSSCNRVTLSGFAFTNSCLLIIHRVVVERIHKGVSHGSISTFKTLSREPFSQR